MKKGKLLSSKTLCETPIFRVTWDHALDPENFEIKRAIIHHGGSAVMLPVDARSRILLVRQYRLPAEDYLWELPAGRVDPGETVFQAARRELREETGLSAKKWKKLAAFYVSPGFLGEMMTIYAATQLTQGERAHADDERITLRWFTRAEIEKSIRSGRIRDAKTIIGALLWFQDKRAKRAKPRRGGSR
jgi:ADP-ribose pyrophosphatase